MPKKWNGNHPEEPNQPQPAGNLSAVNLPAGSLFDRRRFLAGAAAGAAALAMPR